VNEWYSFAKIFFQGYNEQCRRVLDIVEHYRCRYFFL
jgi:hypothetical protein